MVGALAIVEADYFDTAKLGDGRRFKFGATEPATAETAAVQVDQHLVLIFRCDAGAWCIHDCMHATDAGVFGGGGKQFTLTGEISGEQHRHAVGVERECVLCMQCLAQQQQRAAQQSA